MDGTTRALGGKSSGFLVIASAIGALAFCNCASPDDTARHGSEQPATAQRAARPSTSRQHETPSLPRRDRPNGVRLASLPNGDLPFDCTSIRAAIAAERTASQWALDANAEAQRMLDEAPHQYIPPDSLVEFLMPPVGHGRPTDAQELDQFKQLIRMKLCDQLYREIVSRQFAAVNPTYR
jgi:hypothetical protein